MATGVSPERINCTKRLFGVSACLINILFIYILCVCVCPYRHVDHHVTIQRLLASHGDHALRSPSYSGGEKLHHIIFVTYVLI